MSLNRPQDQHEQNVLQHDPAYQHAHHHGKNRRMFELIDLLVERAQAGVMVRVLVWNETNWGYMLDSHRNKHILHDLHPNIEVVRHPPILPVKWSHHQKMVIIDQRIAFIGGIDLVVGRYDDKYSRVCDLDGTIFPGNDYNNLVLGGTESGDPKVTQLDRRIQPRLPWHDTAVCVVGAAAYDAATSIIQIWNHAITHVLKGKGYRRLVPHPNLYQELLARGDIENTIFELDTSPETRPGRVAGGLTCQIVRSISPWASGQAVEASYYRSMLDAIRQARHFVYIQNQYFISSIMHDVPGNKVALAIVERISLAVQNNQNFRVYLVLPVHSAGPVTSIATRAIIKWTRHTIFHGKESIFGKLKERFPGIEPRNYVSVCAMRNWQIANHLVFTEQVYVHSKLMLVDDRLVIIGSGNINDRSMRGARDSETGVVITGGEQIPSMMDGQPVMVSRFVQSLRLQLWNVHLGLFQTLHGYPLSDTRPIVVDSPEEMMAAERQIQDAVADATFFNIWNKTARTNNEIFKEVFGDGIAENWPSVKGGQRRMFTNTEPIVVQKLSTVRGHLIEFPEMMLAHDKGFSMWLLTKRFKVNLVV